MNKQEVYEFLDRQQIQYERTEHKAVYTMDELEDVILPYPEWDAKNLFVRDDKKRNYYLISVKGDKRVDLKQFRKEHGTRPLSFASNEDLKTFLDLEPGSVTPLGLLNDKDKKVIFYLDEYFMDPEIRIGVHPNENTATIWMKTKDLLTVIQQHGNTVHITKI